jgi:hypothetical protein
MKFGLSFLFAICLGAALSAQQVAYVDARAATASEFSGYRTGDPLACEDQDCVRPEAKIEIEKLVLSDKGGSPRVEWTVRLTNQSPNQTIKLPKALAWPYEVRRGSTAKQNVVQVSIHSWSSCWAPDGKATKMNENITTLYGAGDSVVSLAPGQWMRIVGSGGPICDAGSSKMRFYVDDDVRIVARYWADNQTVQGEARPRYFSLDSAEWNGNGEYTPPLCPPGKVCH